MSRLGAVAKNLTATFSSHAVAVLQQLLLTPFFLKNYGAAGFGEWLTLSASVSYLGTLDFGIQTFVNQDLTVRYCGGNMKEFHVVQSTALRMLLCIIVSVGTLALASLSLPLEHWLKMDGTGSGPALAPQVVRETVYALALQVLVSILFGFIAGQFMVLGKAHIGGYWYNAKNLSVIIFSLICIILHASFYMIALAQLFAAGLCTCGVLFTLYRTGPDIFPTLRYWDGTLVPKILKPSGYFAVLFSCQFIVYQAPVLILDWAIGPISVAIFSVSRTIFSMTRNIINGISQSMGPEITRLYGQSDWPRLERLYDYSERLIFAAIPLVNAGVLLLCPLLLSLWLRKPQMFVPIVYLLFAATSVVISAKEHKLSFQYYTNRHRDMARFMLATYVSLVGLWILIVPKYGIRGLLIGWLATESVQAIYTMHLNISLFKNNGQLSLKYPLRLMAFACTLLIVLLPLLPRIASRGLVSQGIAAFIVIAVISIVTFRVFDLKPLWSTIRGRLCPNSLII